MGTREWGDLPLEAARESRDLALRPALTFIGEAIRRSVGALMALTLPMASGLQGCPQYQYS